MFRKCPQIQVFWQEVVGKIPGRMARGAAGNDVLQRGILETDELEGQLQHMAEEALAVGTRHRYRRCVDTFLNFKADPSELPDNVQQLGSEKKMD
ncbi:uncharacterized protein LOC144821482 isoform X2 [Lissotriton helveticus]